MEGRGEWKTGGEGEGKVLHTPLSGTCLVGMDGLGTLQEPQA